jgi:ribokinase
MSPGDPPPVPGDPPPVPGDPPRAPGGPHPDPPVPGPPVGEATAAPGTGARGYPQPHHPHSDPKHDHPQPSHPQPSHSPRSHHPPLLVCVGDLMVDVAVEAPALARGGDVAGVVRLGAGGSAANVAAWAVAAGGRARLVAGRGDDLAGRLLAADLEERGIGLYPDRPVGSATGAMLVVMEAGERSFVADPGANLDLGRGDVVAGVDGAGAVFVSGYPLLRPATRAAAMAAAGAAGRARVPAVVDAASWPLLGGRAGEPVVAAAELAGTLLANREEAAALAGVRDPGAAGTGLAARVGTVVVKCGAAGVVVCAAGRPPVAVPAPAVTAVDVTGAGDAFAAAYLLARAAGADPAEAARAGTGLAAQAVATRGAWPAPPTGNPPAPDPPGG